MSKNLIKNSIRYTSAMIISQFIGLVRGILIPVIFTVSDLGTWNLSNIIINYGNNSHLGSLHGLTKYIPYLKGKNLGTRIDVTISVVFVINVFLGGLFCIGVSIFIYYFNYDLFNYYLILILLVIYLQQIFLFNFNVLRALDSFKLLSSGLIIHALGLTFFTLFFSIIFTDKVLGALVGMALTFFITNVIWLFNSSYNLKFTLDKGITYKIFELGFPLIILGFLDLVFITIDRWLIASFLGIVEVGYYSLGIMVNGIFNLIPGTISSTINQRLIQNHTTDKGVETTALISKSILVMKFVMLVLINVGIFLLPLIIDFILPKYIHSKNVIVIFVFASYFFAISTICTNHLISLNKQTYNIKILLFLIFCSFCINYFLLKTGSNINEVALSTCLLYTLYGTIFIFKSYSILYCSLRSVVNNFIQVLTPFAVLVILFSIESIFLNFSTLSASFLSFLLNLIFIIFYFVYFENRQNILSIVGSLISNLKLKKV